jgi:hypothetical protein
VLSSSNARLRLQAAHDIMMLACHTKLYAAHFKTLLLLLHVRLLCSCLGGQSNLSYINKQQAAALGRLQKQLLQLDSSLLKMPRTSGGRAAGEQRHAKPTAAPPGQKFWSLRQRKMAAVKSAAPRAAAPAAAAMELQLKEAAADADLQGLAQLMLSPSHEKQAAAVQRLTEMQRMAAGDPSMQQRIAEAPAIVSGLVKLLGSNSSSYAVGEAASATLVSFAQGDNHAWLNKRTAAMLDATNWLLEVLGVSYSDCMKPEVAEALTSMVAGGSLLPNDLNAEELMSIDRLVSMFNEDADSTPIAAAVKRLVADEQPTKHASIMLGGATLEICDNVKWLSCCSSGCSGSSSAGGSAAAAAAEALLILEEGSFEKLPDTPCAAAVHGMVQLLGSSSTAVQQAAAAALRDLEHKVRRALNIMQLCSPHDFAYQPSVLCLPHHDHGGNDCLLPLADAC